MGGGLKYKKMEGISLQAPKLPLEPLLMDVPMVLADIKLFDTLLELRSCARENIKNRRWPFHARCCCTSNRYSACNSRKNRRAAIINEKPAERTAQMQYIALHIYIMHVHCASLSNVLLSVIPVKIARSLPLTAQTGETDRNGESRRGI